MDKSVGFTTTIPVEVVFAGGCTPVDLNNVFISDQNPMRFIEKAETDGFPKSMCNWVKGIYGVVMERGIETVITVMEGDCSNTIALSEILQYRGVKTIPFSFPYDRDQKILRREIEKLMDVFLVDWEGLAKKEVEIEKVRERLAVIDRMTWKESVVSGEENHLWLVRASDMLGDYGQYGHMAADFIENAKKRTVIKGINVGYIGVPPIPLDLYLFIESIGAHVVYNEVQRQFSLPYFGKDITERYLLYTYPYEVFSRVKDIKKEVRRRGIKGIIHYVQAFCFRIMEDVILRDSLGIPVITIEGDLPKPLDGRTKLRIEAFIEMLAGRQNGEE
ncbi:MAG: 2-hydroxyacyl-CoA dehydratase [Syntrophobacterales bacterium]|jgi:benzoyl-CoA reductase/2-hydroxyglutaryl-CoA dehydratase subunit BcrC/BadD/HgdB|nr:2-hydroxyacyl-CoA dehydratase [Syntrophobacterales bacterium]